MGRRGRGNLSLYVRKTNSLLLLKNTMINPVQESLALDVPAKKRECKDEASVKEELEARKEFSATTT